MIETVKTVLNILVALSRTIGVTSEDGIYKQGFLDALIAVAMALGSQDTVAMIEMNGQIAEKRRKIVRGN